MRKGLTIGLLALAALPAQAEIFKCSDPSGHVTYSNVASKGCTRLNLDPISTVPAAKAAPKTPTPSTFPRVEESTQKSRDTDRRKILEQERATEQKSLDEARKKLAEADNGIGQDPAKGISRTDLQVEHVVEASHCHGCPLVALHGRIPEER